MYICLKEYVSELYLVRQIEFLTQYININDIRLISEKLNELKWKPFLKEKNIDFRSKEINRKIYE